MQANTLYRCPTVLGGCGGSGRVTEEGDFCQICSAIVDPPKSEWRRCDGVVGGCGGTGKIRGTELLCPKCIASKDD